MPFKIIRTNLTKVHADAIVNTANPMPVYGDGTDRAIYMAAGADELLAERRKIGAISRGEAAVDSSFTQWVRYGREEITVSLRRSAPVTASLCFWQSSSDVKVLPSP